MLLVLRIRGPTIAETAVIISTGHEATRRAFADKRLRVRPRRRLLLG